ncbi:perlucin-like [Malaya genurostris]|uniref:perlucin-like n=1 Tax=Malaya genurostris TaxID=325434 RepID=UPI0026F3A465|nr:perlucin-like [Malaya genurostris]
MQGLVLATFILTFVRCFAQDLQCVSYSKYYIPAFKANWYRAGEICNSLGMRLAIVTSPEHNNNIANAVMASSCYNATRTQVWIGGSDLAEEGQFYWQPTGTWFSYTNWLVGQPDNAGNSEDCVEIRHYPSYDLYWGWNDLNCEILQHFVCENGGPRSLP